MKGFKWFVAGMIVTVMLTGVVFAAGGIKSAVYNSNKVIFDGKEINVTAMPMITVIKEGEKDGSNYMPVRAVLEGMGYDVAWDSNAKAVVVKTKAETISDKNVDVKITWATLSYDYGAELDFEAVNNTKETISRFDFYLYSYDAYGRELDAEDTTFYQNGPIKPGEKLKSYLDLYMLNDATYKVTFGIYKYVTSSGKVVEIPTDKIFWQYATMD